MKTALTALLGMAMVADAAIIPNTDSSSLDRRQGNKFNPNFNKNRAQFNGQFGGGQFGGGNFNGNAGNNGQNGNANKGGNNGGSNQAAANTCLAAGAIQTGSAQTGQSGAQAADGQVNSKTYVESNIMRIVISLLTF